MRKLLNKRWIAFLLSCLAVAVLCVPAITAAPTDDRVLTITKSLIAEDIYWDHGNPTFIYELSTIVEQPGDTGKYFAVIEFTQDYVAANTQPDGTVSKTTTIENLAPHKYTLEERDVLRYETPATNIDVDGTIAIVVPFHWTPTGEQINKPAVDINLQKYENAEVTYHGIKIDWADASHNDLVVNNFTVLNP